MQSRYIFLCISVALGLFAAVKGATSNIDETIGNVHFDVVGGQNIPQITFSVAESSANSSITYGPYYLRIKSAYEATVQNGSVKQIGNSVQQLNGGWNFTDVRDNGDNVQFNLTSGIAYKGQTQQWASFSIRVAIWRRNATGSPCPNDVCLKFDLVFAEYLWVGGDDSAALVVAVWASSDANDNLTLIDSSVENSSTLYVGKGYISAVKSATANNATVNVTPQLDKNGAFLLVFNHFPNGSTLEYDPMVGIDYSLFPLGLIIGLSVGGVLLIVAAIIGIVLYNRRKSQGYSKL